MKRFLTLAALAIIASAPAVADLPPELQAKFIKIICSNAGSAGKVCVKDGAMTGKLGEVGVAADAASKVAYAGSEADLAAYKGKLIICPKLEWLPKGGAIAIVEEGGKPAIYLHMQNIGASGVTLSDAVMKIGKPAK